MFNKQGISFLRMEGIEQNTRAPSSCPKSLSGQNILFSFVLHTMVKLDLISLVPSWDLESRYLTL